MFAARQNAQVQACSSPPSAAADYICQQSAVQDIGQIDAISEQLFAITTERQFTHPAIVAISRVARDELFDVVPPELAGQAGA